MKLVGLLQTSSKVNYSSKAESVLKRGKELRKEVSARVKSICVSAAVASRSIGHTVGRSEQTQRR